MSGKAFDTPTEIMPLEADAVEIARMLDERYKQGWQLFHILDPVSTPKVLRQSKTPHPPSSVVYVFRQTTKTNTLF